ncbi:MAG: NAD(P)/FAD-dependent oxidoreductase [Planctomycetes bacterium]|nr:NAD(P)/FAD-dependent oxidoreductase [Planctomycetota bacterium]
MVVDVAIVGGGPAGSALAIELGRRGRSVRLLEKARHPRPKACGEGLLPQGVDVLRRMDLLEPALKRGFPAVRGMRFVGPSGGEVSCDFPDGFGLVVRRERFDEWLFREAASTPHVEALEGVRIGDPAELKARLIVGADGLHSIFHGRGAFRPLRSNRVGQSAHARMPLDDRVEVRFLADGELYLAPSGPGEALVASLGERFVPLQERRPGVEFTSSPLARAPLGLVMHRVVDGNVLLIGDAAGAPDPITGEGLSLALMSARLAARVIAEGEPLWHYEAARLAMGENAHRFGLFLRRLSGRPWLADRVIDRMRRRPHLLSGLMDVAVGRRPAAALGLIEMIRRVV